MQLIKMMGFVLALMLLPAGVYAAGPVDVDLQAGVWRNGLSGDVRYQGGDINVKSDLGLDDVTKEYVRARLHVAWLGNLYAGYAPIDFAETANLTKSVTFGKFTFVPGLTDSKVDLKMYDVGWTFTALDAALVALELGINAKFLDGSIALTNSSQSETADISVPVPMVKAILRMRGPFVGADVDSAAITYDGNHVIDLMAQVRVSPWPVFYLAGGYRYLDLEVKDGDKHAAVKTKGPFIGLGLDF